MDKTTPNNAKNWCLTWYYPPKNWVTSFDRTKARVIFARLEFTKKETSADGIPKPHIQRYFKFATRTRPSTIWNRVCTDPSDWSENKHWTRALGNIAENYAYCLKDVEPDIMEGVDFVCHVDDSIDLARELKAQARRERYKKAKGKKNGREKSNGKKSEAKASSYGEPTIKEEDFFWWQAMVYKVVRSHLASSHHRAGKILYMSESHENILKRQILARRDGMRRDGDIGKTTLVKYMLWHHPNEIMYLPLETGKSDYGVEYQVIKFQERHGTTPKIVLVDCPRGMQPDSLNWKLLENLCNMRIGSSKYEGGVCTGEKRLVIVFSNHPLSIKIRSQITANKWCQITLPSVDINPSNHVIDLSSPYNFAKKHGTYEDLIDSFERENKERLRQIREQLIENFEERFQNQDEVNLSDPPIYESVRSHPTTRSLAPFYIRRNRGTPDLHEDVGINVLIELVRIGRHKKFISPEDRKFYYGESLTLIASKSHLKIKVSY